MGWGGKEPKPIWFWHRGRGQPHRAGWHKAPLSRLAPKPPASICGVGWGQSEANGVGVAIGTQLLGGHYPAPLNGLPYGIPRSPHLGQFPAPSPVSSLWWALGPTDLWTPKGFPYGEQQDGHPKPRVRGAHLPAGPPLGSPTESAGMGSLNPLICGPRFPPLPQWVPLWGALRWGPKLPICGSPFHGITPAGPPMRSSGMWTPFPTITPMGFFIVSTGTSTPRFGGTPLPNITPVGPL